MPKLTKAALQRKKPVTDNVLIPADDEQAAKLARAREALRNVQESRALAEISGDEAQMASAELRVARAEIELEAIKEDIGKTGTAFTLYGVGRVRWDELISEHPPTAEQLKENEESATTDTKFTFDPATFWPALLAESVRDSDLKAEDWDREVFKSKAWGPEELEELRTRALMVNQASRIVALGNG